MDVRVGLWRKLSTKELMLLTVVLEKTLESPLVCKEIKPVHPKGDQSWVFIGMTDVEAETPILWPPNEKSWLIWKDPDAGKDWGQEKEGDDRGWNGWMASPTQWTWVWVDSGSWWWTGRPGVLQFMGLQRSRHDWATELNWTTRGRSFCLLGWEHWLRISLHYMFIGCNWNMLSGPQRNSLFFSLVRAFSGKF